MEQLIDELLRHSFFLMTEAALNDNAATSEVLAGTLFNYAVNMGWIAAPQYSPDLAWVDVSEFDVDPGQFSIDGEQLVELGDWEVPLEYRRKFFERIRGVTANSDDDVAPPLTFKTDPQKKLKDFCKAYNFSATGSFIKMIAPQKDGSVDLSMKRRIERAVLEKPDIRKRTSKRPNDSQRVFAEFMRGKMVAYDSARKKKFIDMKTEDLLWIRA